MTNYRLFDGASGRPGVGSSGTQPPTTGNGGSGAWLAGTSFDVTQGGMWLEGYWWWVANSGQPTTPATFALWEVLTNTTGTFVTGSNVTSGTLTAGAMNYVPLATPMPLSIGAPYMAVVGYNGTGNFPYSPNQFGTSQPYVAGITNGPLFAPGNGGWHSIPQGAYSQAGSDPTAIIPDNAINNAILWVDVQVSDTAPAGYSGSYRLWPNQPNPDNWALDTPQNTWTLATEFKLNQPCKLNKIWFYSPAGSTQLPTWCGIWLVSSQATVSGTVNSSPSWSGAAGSGWISCSYSGVTLPAGDYKVTVFNGGSIANAWSATTFPYWGTTGVAAAAGITTGPLSAPNDANATSPGQSTYQQAASPAYPLTYASGIGSATYWVDVEVTPAASGSGLLMASGIV